MWCDVIMRLKKNYEVHVSKVWLHCDVTFVIYNVVLKQNNNIIVMFVTCGCMQMKIHLHRNRYGSTCDVIEYLIQCIVLLLTLNVDILTKENIPYSRIFKCSLLWQGSTFSSLFFQNYGQTRRRVDRLTDTPLKFLLAIQLRVCWRQKNKKHKKTQTHQKKHGGFMLSSRSVLAKINR